MLGERVYVTVDMDGLDPSIAPGVGTPEPGGLTWQQILGLLRQVCLKKYVVAADIVEVRPIPLNCITEFTAARLAYKIIAYTQQCHSSRAAAKPPPAGESLDNRRHVPAEARTQATNPVGRGDPSPN